MKTFLITCVLIISCFAIVSNCFALAEIVDEYDNWFVVGETDPMTDKISYALKSIYEPTTQSSMWLVSNEENPFIDKKFLVFVSAFGANICSEKVQYQVDENPEKSATGYIMSESNIISFGVSKETKDSFIEGNTVKIKISCCEPIKVYSRYYTFSLLGFTKAYNRMRELEKKDN